MPAAQARARAREARSQLYRQLVLEAAERVFAESGFEAARMEEVAAKSGLSLGTLYSVFSGKADVFQAVHEIRTREVLARATDAAAGLDDPLAMLIAGVKAYVEFFLAHPDYLRMHLREGHAWGLGLELPGSRVRAEAWREGVAMQRALFARGIDAGVFHPGDPELLARMMIAMQQVQLAAWVEGGMQRASEDLVAEIETHIGRSFCVAETARG
jgi:AcrR family transcriptional regulator